MTDTIDTLAGFLRENRAPPFEWTVALGPAPGPSWARAWRRGNGTLASYQTILVALYGRAGAVEAAAACARAAAERFHGERADEYRVWANRAAAWLQAITPPRGTPLAATQPPHAIWGYYADRLASSVTHAMAVAFEDGYVSDLEWTVWGVYGASPPRGARVLGDLPPPALADVLAGPRY